MFFRAKIFWLGVSGFILGLVVSNSSISFSNFIPHILGAGFLILIFSIVFKRKKILLFGIFIFSFSLAIFRFDVVSGEQLSERELRAYQNISAEISGRVIDVEKRENSYRTTIRVEEINEKMFENEVGIIVRHVGAPKALPGDIATFSGVLEIPESFQTDSGRTFEYPKYLEARGISLILDDGETVSFVINENSFRKTLYNLRTSALSVFNSLSPSASSLISGMTLGARESIPDSLNDAMITTGTIHIVALSGYNVTLVSGVVIFLLTAILGKRRAYIPAGLAIILFVLLAGGGSPAIRAAVLATLYLVSQYLGGNYSIARAIAFAFCMMLFWNPFLLTDLSFELSFLATLGIIYIPPKIEKYFKWITKRLGFRDVVLISIGAQIAVLPLLVFETGVLSIVSVPINILISPLVPAIMVLGFVAIVLSIFGPLIMYPIVFLSGFVTDILIFIIQKGALLPHGAIIVPEVNILWVVIIYIIVAYIFFWKAHSLKKEE